MDMIRGMVLNFRELKYAEMMATTAKVLAIFHRLNQPLLATSVYALVLAEWPMESKAKIDDSLRWLTTHDLLKVVQLNGELNYQLNRS